MTTIMVIKGIKDDEDKVDIDIDDQDIEDKDFMTQNVEKRIERRKAKRGLRGDRDGEKP